MFRQQILNAIIGLDDSGVIETETRSIVVKREGHGLWVLKSFMGDMFYTDTELADELANGEEEIFRIS